MIHEFNSYKKLLEFLDRIDREPVNESIDEEEIKEEIISEHDLTVPTGGKYKVVLEGEGDKFFETENEAQVFCDEMNEKRLSWQPQLTYQLNEDLEHDVFTVPRGTGAIEIIKNPTGSDYDQLKKEFDDKYPWARGSGEPYSRQTYDKDGNKYIWSSDYMHYQVEPIINKKYNTKTNQNYRWWENDVYRKDILGDSR